MRSTVLLGVALLALVPEALESLPAPQVFIPGTDEAFVTSRESGFTKVYRMSMETMNLGEPVFEVPERDVSGVIQSDDGNRVLGYYTFEDGQERAVYTDETLKAVKAALEGEDLKKGVIVHITSKGSQRFEVLKQYE